MSKIDNILQGVILHVLSVAAKKPIKKEVGKQKSAIKITIIDIPEIFLERIWHYWLPGTLVIVPTIFICYKIVTRRITMFMILGRGALTSWPGPWYLTTQFYSRRCQ